MSNVSVSPADVAQMIERVRETGEPVVRFVTTVYADADADAYPTEKELYWERRRRLESYWWSDGCALIFDTIVAPIWKKIHANYWELVIADRNRRRNNV